MNYKTINTCRLCGSDDLTYLFSLGTQYVSDFVNAQNLMKGLKVPITLMLCRYCTLVQLQDTAPQEILYSRHYWYRSGVNQTMRSALADITQQVEKLVYLQPEDVVCDIGSNDGTLLRSYTAKGITRVGVEPANNLVEEGSKGLEVFIHDFWSAGAYFSQVSSGAKVVTAIGMFYDLDDPNKFIADIAKVLRKDGLFIAQLMCLKNMYDLSDVGNLAHEHLEFYSFKSLEYLFHKHGLEIIDVFVNQVNGQSYRILAKLINGSVQPQEGSEERIRLIKESEASLDRPEVYGKFYQDLEDNKQEVVDFIEKEVDSGKKVWVYGASTKGNVMLQYYGLDNTLIEGAADRSQYKWGKYTVGTRIPIYPEDVARSVNPDYFLVLPYAFVDEFREREQDWVNKGGKFIVPLPKMKIIGRLCEH